MTRTCPKCGSTKIENDECLHCGIYLSKYLAYLSKRGAPMAAMAAAAGAPAAGVVTPAAAPTGQMDEVDYTIFGGDIQFVEVELDPGEAAVAEPGAMLYMQADVTMETSIGDGSQAQSGFIGRLFGAGGRLLTGESLFITAFRNHGLDKRRVAFAAPMPGKIIPIRLADVGGELLAQKGAFLAGARGVNIGIAFQQKLGAGFLGGMGFVIESLKGSGMVFVSGAGSVCERALAAGETLRVQTGCIVALEPYVTYSVEYVGNIKSALFGGQGLVFATLTGPGRVWLQSPALANLMRQVAASARRGRSSLGAAGGASGLSSSDSDTSDRSSDWSSSDGDSDSDSGGSGSDPDN